MQGSMIELDGAAGGGQILRSALALAMITGTPFKIVNVRGKRPRPGLMRQHLVAVRAAAQVCGAQVEGAEPGSTALRFVPGTIRGGDYSFAIGSAGSCTLLLQTVLPALLHADAPSVVRVSGGTHNPLAPPAHFIQRSYVPLLRRMGAELSVELERFGFCPAGGGALTASISPARALQPLDLVERGELRQAWAEAFVAGVRGSIAQRELAAVGAAFGWPGTQLRNRGLPAEQGPGNVLLLTFEHANVTEVVAGFGERFVTAEDVAGLAIAGARRYLDSGAAVGEHLADQLMLPLALAGGGSFTCPTVSDHVVTHADVIARFLPVRFHIEREHAARWRVQVVHA